MSNKIARKIMMTTSNSIPHKSYASYIIFSAGGLSYLAKPHKVCEIVCFLRRHVLTTNTYENKVYTLLL